MKMLEYAGTAGICLLSEKDTSLEGTDFMVVDQEVNFKQLRGPGLALIRILILSWWSAAVAVPACLPLL